VAQDIKNRLKKEIGEVITLSVGVSFNKLLAKLASGTNKPDGFAVIDKDNLQHFYRNTELTDICGIGERLKIRLNCLSIYTFEHLQKASLLVLKKEFGNVMADHLKKLAYLRDDSSVIPYDQPQIIKSVGRNYCLSQNEYDQTKIMKTVYELCCEVGVKLRKLNKKARTVGLALSGDRSESSEKTILRYIDLDKDIFDVCKYIYDKWKWNSMVRQIRVWTVNLTDYNTTTIGLFENKRLDGVVKIVDRINEKYGGETIRNGSLIYTDKLKTKPNGYMADRYERSLFWK